MLYLGIKHQRITWS